MLGEERRRTKKGSPKGLTFISLCRKVNTGDSGVEIPVQENNTQLGVNTREELERQTRVT